MKYLRKSVVNACGSYHRRRLLERRHRPRAPRPGIDEPSELWDVLDRLSQRQRTALVLCYYLDPPEEETATFLLPPVDGTQSRASGSGGLAKGVVGMTGRTMPTKRDCVGCTAMRRRTFIPRVR